MEIPTEKQENTGTKLGTSPVERNPDGTIKSGHLNPYGRPLGAKNFTTKVKEALMLIGQRTEDGKEISYEEALVKKILKLAIIDGDQQMIKLIWNYLDGMPTYRLEGNISTTNYDLTAEEKEKLDKLLYADK